MLRALLLPVLGLLAAGPWPAPARAQAVSGSPLVRLADALAEDLERVAPESAFEIAPIEDRAGASGAWGEDLRALLVDRLRARLATPGRGARARVSAILSQAGPRLIVSARVEALPDGRLIDVVSASTEADPALLELAASPPPAVSRAVEVTATARTPPLDESVLDLAWIDSERLLLLSPQALALYRVADGTLTLESRQVLPAADPPVRTPGGLLWPLRREGAAWALVSGVPQAVLFALDGRRLSERSRADAVPLPRLPAGVRMRPGTNLIDADLPGLGPGPWLAVEPGWPDGAVSAAAELVLADAGGPRPSGVRAGTALAPLWEGVVVATSADPPSARDALLLLRIEGGQAREAGRLSVDGAARALAAWPVADGARLVAALAEPGGTFHLELFELRRPEAGAELP